MLIAAVIPAYNEEKTISNVISVLKETEIIDQIIVVSDGSSDRTTDIAIDSEVQVIVLERNMGKGSAMKHGLDATTAADIILFLDADLIGLRTEHISALLLPLLEDRADMTVGIFGKGRLATDFAHKIAPFLSGQRAVKREIIDKIPDLDSTGFGVEMVLTKHMTNNNFRVKEVCLSNLTHVTKEEKIGFVRGITARMKMYWEIVKCTGKG
jgi:glycosyltransferase involved in cell wall biosynthesis